MLRAASLIKISTPPNVPSVRSIKCPEAEGSARSHSNADTSTGVRFPGPAHRRRLAKVCDEDFPALRRERERRRGADSRDLVGDENDLVLKSSVAYDTGFVLPKAV